MAKAILCTIFFIYSYTLYGQKLIITQVDASETGFYNVAALKVLATPMEIAIKDSSISIKTNDNNRIILKKVSPNEYSKIEWETDKEIATYKIKLHVNTSIVTSAEFTAVIIEKSGNHKAIWWTITAKKPD
jgi:hypothetical protein